MPRVNYYRKWKAEGKCVYCGGTLDRNGLSCSKCFERRRANGKIWNKRFRERHPNYYQKYRGTSDYRTRAREYRRRHKEKLRKLKLTLIDELGGKCQRCGFDDKRALVFHHKNGRKENAGRIYDTPFKFNQYKRETAQLELLCANCHFIEHFG